MNVETEPNGGTHLGMYNFEEKWKHLVPGGNDDLFDAYMQQSSKQKPPAAVDDGLSYFTQVNLMSNSAEISKITFPYNNVLIVKYVHNYYST